MSENGATELNSDFVFTENFEVTDDVKNAFNQNGYILLRGLLDSEELTKLKTAVENDEGLQTQNYGRSDGEGRRTKVVLWNHPGKDITGVVARSEKMAGTFEQLLGGEVYHYHAKVIMKEPNTGGAHVWHQDYGYWYENGCMFPDMGTAWLAIDRSNKENGCLKILVGSNRLGRIEHKVVGDQVGADLERVEMAQKVCPLRYVEVEPGDCLFFHSNVLHRSEQNNSPHRRWAYLVAYNRASNNPLRAHHHPQYTPMTKVPNSAIRQCSTVTDMTGKDFFHGPREDMAIKQLGDKEGS